MLFPLGFLHQQHEPGGLVPLTWGGAHDSAEQLGLSWHHHVLADQYGFQSGEYHGIASMSFVRAHRLGKFRWDGYTRSRFGDQGVRLCLNEQRSHHHQR